MTELRSLLFSDLIDQLMLINRAFSRGFGDDCSASIEENATLETLNEGRGWLPEALAPNRTVFPDGLVVNSGNIWFRLKQKDDESFTHYVVTIGALEDLFPKLYDQIVGYNKLIARPEAIILEVWNRMKSKPNLFDLVREILTKQNLTEIRELQDEVKAQARLNKYGANDDYGIF